MVNYWIVEIFDGMDDFDKTKENWNLLVDSDGIVSRCDTFSEANELWRFFKKNLSGRIRLREVSSQVIKTRLDISE